MNSIILLSLKEQLLKASKEAESSGLCRHKTGNISVINRKEQYIVITPSAISKAKLVLADLVICDYEGTLLENQNNNAPSSELAVHLACYRKREDIDSIIHTHSTYVTAFAAKERPVPPVVSEAEFYGNKTTVISYRKPRSQELAEQVAEEMGDADVLILAKHGAVIMGKGIADTLLKAKYAEEVAKVAILAEIIR